jgi:hypothetical protein
LNQLELASLFVPTLGEWEMLPLTSEIEWDPSVMNHEPNDSEVKQLEPYDHSPFDEFFQYCQRVIVQYTGYFMRHNTVSD